MKIHFIGIGGIGVSALAKYYLEKGHQVSGSDLVSSEITEALKKKGAQLFIGRHKAKNLPSGTDMVVHSLAVPATNPELKAARKKGIKCLSYPQVLGELTKKYFTIAVSGTHGKSTTTAMIGLLLVKAGFDPTVIVGTKLKEFGNLVSHSFHQNLARDSGASNCRIGKSQYLVIEADEHFGSFLNYWPKIIVLTNIEEDHLDYYKNLRNILKTYKKYISHLPQDGILVANADDVNISKLKTQNSKPQLKTQNYSLKQKKEVKKLKKILKVPGDHNVYNALAALTVARVLKIPDKISFKALSEYRGCWRRFEEKSCFIKRATDWLMDKERRIINFKVISDYGHHPTEIRVTLKAAREKYPKKKIWLIYQPHQYQRTYYLFKDFVKVLREAPVDKLIITDIYDVAGREEKKIKEKVNSVKLVRAIKAGLAKDAVFQGKKFFPESVVYLSNFEKIKDYLIRNLKGGEVVIIMGAGDIYNLFLHLTDKKER